jgi:hypothetical protein
VHWDGAHWTVTPLSFVNGGELFAIHAIAANDIWAVGYYFQPNGSGGSTAEPLILHWAGGPSWQDLSPAQPGDGGQLEGVDAVDADHASAVGTSDGADTSLAERWDGQSWELETSESPGTAPSNVLWDVAATSGGRWAVGGYESATGASRTLIEKRTASGWVQVPSPNPGSGDRVLFGVDDVSSGDLWAAGSKTVSGGVLRNLVVHRTTGSWSAVVVPNAGGTGENNELRGLDALGSGHVWAVGDHYGTAGGHPLILHACGA